MKTWRASVNLSIGYLTSEQILKEDWIKENFKDPTNPTEAEIKRYFEGCAEALAGSNDGSERIANAHINITCEDK